MNENEWSQTLEQEEALPTEEESAAAEETAQTQSRMSWEEILADPEYRRSYDEAVQRIVQKRLRARAGAEARLERLAPVLQALQTRYGVDWADETLDMHTLAERVSGEEERRVAAEETERHLDALLEQARVLRESVPDFELLRALEDPRLLRLTAPHSGVGLADAWYALHRDEIGRQAARESLEALSKSVRSGGRRPRELHDRRGDSGQTPPARMNREEREALKKRILEAKAQGRRLPVGD